MFGFQVDPRKSESSNEHFAELVRCIVGELGIGAENGRHTKKDQITIDLVRLDDRKSEVVLAGNRGETFFHRSA